MFNSYDKFTTNFKKVIQRAAWVCLNDSNTTITADNILTGLILVSESLAFDILKKSGVLGYIQQFATASIGSAQEPKNVQSHEMDYNEVFSLSMNQSAINILEKAADCAVRLNALYIGTEHLLYAILESGFPPLISALKKAKITPEELKQNLLNLMRETANKQTVDTADVDRTNASPSSSLKNYQQSKRHANEQREERIIEKIIKKEKVIQTPALDHFTIDLTSKAAQKKLKTLVGREKEMMRLINILSRKEKNNPLLLGEPGVGKTALIHGLAKKIYNETVPDILSNKRILNLDLNAVVAGTIYRGEFESRLKQIIDETTAQDDVILFIDEIHNIVGAGSASGSLDAANILKPYLARGELSCIGATTMAEYKAHFENDATLDRRFQSIIIDEPTPEETISILSGLKPQLEEFHRITITSDALKEAVVLSDRFLPHKFFPDKAIDLLDEAASRAKVIHSKDIYGKKIRIIKHTLKQLQEKKEYAVRSEDFQKAISFKADEERLLVKLHNLKQKQLKLQKTKVGAIDKEHIAQIVSSMLHIPFLEVTNLNTEKLLNLESALGNHVFGQEKVLGEIARTLRRSGAGLSDPKRPLASFIFLGPSGVGKTETVKAIAEELFGDRNALIRINMSEFQESFSSSKLIGAPAGYIGYKDGNQLADKVRQKPYSVVLFDEMEKAHSDVFNLLLQVLEDGYMQDAAGKHINFKNTIIVFTSNIGLERFNQVQQLGFGARKSNEREHLKDQFELIKEHIMEELYSTYRVEFLNRIDKLLVFDPLQPKTVLRIVEKTVSSLNDRLTDKGITVALSSAAKKLLAKESFSPDDGARSVRRVIQEKVEELLVEKILKKEFSKGDVVTVQAKGKVISVQK